MTLNYYIHNSSISLVQFNESSFISSFRQAHLQSDIWLLQIIMFYDTAVFLCISFTFRTDLKLVLRLNISANDHASKLFQVSFFSSRQKRSEAK